ncbi:hypothetical protein OIU76_006799 [Salix suchowensis]|nr:hypothetical protein OIU76_006799 [Salix suchowensis]
MAANQHPLKRLMISQPPNPAKPRKLKESKAKKGPAPKKPRHRAPSSHPPYEEMIKDAIVTLKEKTGSSQYAITKFLEEKHKQLPSNFKKLLLFSFEEACDFR